MSAMEAVTVMLPAEMAAEVRDAVSDGLYASSSDIVQEALVAWKAWRDAGRQSPLDLEAEIEIGMADLREGRLVDFDVADIAERGRLSLNRRLGSA